MLVSMSSFRICLRNIYDVWDFHSFPFVGCSGDKSETALVPSGYGKQTQGFAGEPKNYLRRDMQGTGVLI
jgi:hypothetical protein